MNKVFLSGNLTRDPEVRYTQTGKAFARMGIAVRRPFSKDKDAVDFFNIVAFDKTAEFCGKYLFKGSRVLVEGRLQTSSYEAQDGSKRTSTEILIDNIEFADSKRANSGGDDSWNNRGNDGGGYQRNRGDDGSGYSRNNRGDDSGYSRNRGDNDGYQRNNPPPGREEPPQKKFTDDEFIGEQLDIEDPPF